MNWGMVEIEDRKGKLHAGEEAMNFVLEYLEGRIVIKPYAGDTFALQVNGSNVVDPSEVERLFSDGLSARARRVTVRKPQTEPKSNFLPNRRTENPINIVPKYSITFDLGDIDALFDPITETAEPWKDKGVQQRMQALGYFYTQLSHPDKDDHAKLCWEYYGKRVHKDPTGKPPGNAELIGKLRKEIQNNLVTADFPKRGEIFDDSRLPQAGSMGAIRLPGGFSINFPRLTLVAQTNAQGEFVNPSVEDRAQTEDGTFIKPADGIAPFDFELGEDRFKAEETVYANNELIGKIPLIATVSCDWGEGRITHPPDVPVYFQLIMPDPLIPPEDDGGSKFCAPKLRNKLMAYGKNWTVWEDRTKPSDSKLHEDYKGFNLDFKQIDQDGYGRAYDAAHNAFQKPAGQQRDGVITEFARKETEDLTSAAEDAAAASARITAEDEQLKAQKRDLEAELAALESEPGTQDSKEGVTQAHEALTLAKAELSDAEGIDESDADRQNKIDAATAKVEAAQHSVDLKAKAYEDGFPLVTAKKKELEEKQKEISAKGFQGWEATTNKNKTERARKAKYDLLVKVVKWIMSHAPDPVNGYELTAPGVGLAQRKFVENLRNSTQQDAIGKDALDPQQWNCPSKYGGKADLPVEGSAGKPGVFENAPAPRSGFHSKRNEQTTDYGDLNLATVPGDKAMHPYAMECKTNDKGNAGVIFMPSRIGGDSYKLRAYVDPKWLSDHAPGIAHDPKAESGTMVVWRNIRLARYIKRSTPSRPYSKEVMEMLAFNSDRFKGYSENKERAERESKVAKESLEEAKSELRSAKSSLELAQELGDSVPDKQERIDAATAQVASAEELVAERDDLYKQKYSQNLNFKSNNPVPNQAYTFGDTAFDRMSLDSPVIDLELLPGSPSESVYPRTDPREIDLSINSAALRHYRPIATKPTPAKTHFSQCYCEWIADCDDVEEMDQNELKNALKNGITAARSSKKFDLVNLDWETLVFYDPSSPFVFNQRSYEHYNKLIEDRGESAMYPPIDRENDDVVDQFVRAFYFFVDYTLQHFAGGGVWPGLTLIQVPRIESWDPRAVNERTVTTSGYGAPCRAAVVSHTKPVYEGDDFCYSNTANALHELGHVLGLTHQDPYPGGDVNMHQGQPDKPFKNPGQDDCVCLMGYYGCYGELCGRCVLTLRGWKTKSKHSPDGA